MHTLFALVLTAAAACVIARPPGSFITKAVSPDGSPAQGPLEAPSHRFLRDYLLPRYLWPQYFGYEESPRIHHSLPQIPATDWLNKEIDRINRMQERAAYKTDLPRWKPQEPYIKRIFAPASYDVQPYLENSQSLPSRALIAAEALPRQYTYNTKNTKTPAMPVVEIRKQDKKSLFAFTPLEKGYFEPNEKENSSASKMSEGHDEGGGHPMIELEPPRQTRQNPNLSRIKPLVSQNLGILREGLSNKEYRLPVSLLPSNLRWLKHNQPNMIDESGHEAKVSGTELPRHIHVQTSPPELMGSLYGVAVIAAICAALTLAILGFAVGWYTLFKRAKAAADVDYPAYGVTGPNIDASGDKKLAHSAHMYHYQHQKQQIIAMERNGMEHRNGSVSDPESEEENEEGDYTVYECPGFATTGDMEVKNPLFNEDPTPATPGKCEVVKTQPKE